MDVALGISHLNKSFGKKKIIDDVSFEVYSGEVFGFLGPNGAGKTTTIKMIMGFLSVDSGIITISGVDHLKHYEKAMENIGGIVENPEMYKDLSGRVNLEMYARLHKGVTKERIREVLTLVGMQERAEENVKKYSLGMKQRIGLAQALLHRPKVLILDEPTNGLDPAGIHELRDILKKLAHEENVAVVVSSHLLSEMQLMCDRVGIISSGKFLGVKTIDELTGDSTGESVFHFVLDQVESAKTLLSTAYADKIRTCTDTSLDLAIPRDSVPNAIRVMATKGINIYGVSKLESSLEEVFLEITGGGLTIE